MARPRARFQSDLEAAITAGAGSPNITDICPGQYDGEFSFNFRHESLSPVEIQVSTQEVTSYPSEHYFITYAISDVPQALEKPLGDFLSSSFGLKVAECLATLSRSLSAALGDDDDDEVMTDVDDLDNVEGTENGSDGDDDDDIFEGFEVSEDQDDLFGLDIPDARAHGGVTIQGQVTPETLGRVRRDFLALRRAGFKVGRLCGFEEATEYHIMSTSVRVDKLCLSLETLDAWNLAVDEFVVLLIRFDRHYTTFEEALDRASQMSNLQFRLRKCTKCRPSINQAVKAFSSQTNAKLDTGASQADSEHPDRSELSLLGIGETIDEFMQTELISILKLRDTRPFLDWDGAKKELSHMTKTIHQTEKWEHSQSSSASASASALDSDEMKLPAFLAKNYLQTEGEKSLPLLAAQFAMRYLVRCTDYCMICHQKVEGNFEALKPYVCGNTLCLFQYMSMGCGPSIDYEIINQPYVIDLLISFCYASLRTSQSGHVRYGGNASNGPAIREFPTGLNLQVPNVLQGQTGQVSKPQGSSAYHTEVTLADPMQVSFDWDQSTVEVEESDIHRIREGQWVTIVSSADDAAAQPHLPDIAHHARVEQIKGRLLVVNAVSRHTLPGLSQAVTGPIQVSNEQTWRASVGAGALSAKMLLYDHNLDDYIGEIEKAYIISLLLATIPPVQEMRSYLMQNRNRRIEKWNRLSPAAFKLLRWIVASNRSYIVQVDECTAGDDAERSPGRKGEKISGVSGWIQFRFAQGSPEKELLFQKELRQVAKNKKKTILAWHGSPLQNWHSIIRQGLDFKVTAHGRAYGNGVYFSKSFDYSHGYTNMGYGGDGNHAGVWPNSALQITSALSLNELPNMPERFVHKDACYVVQHTRWIQCRYLFVRNTRLQDTSNIPPSANRTDAEYKQDPTYAAVGPANCKIFIPHVAIHSAQDDTKPLVSKLSALGHSGDSGDEDAEDIEFLFSGDEAEPAIPIMASMNSLAGPKTDFRPGTLDLATLPKSNSPSYATPQAQKAIGREITTMQKIQSETPPHELGWYIDFDKIDNMFHWIVELHSFDSQLPLAKDMKTAGMTSIILEMRFGRDYPMSPPFVRVIRPRFLPFMSGGGGHVTAGGAMCMELLTNSGWSPVSSLESVLLQVRMAISSTDPKPARLENNQRGHSNRTDYGIGEAFDAYTRAALTHGWKVPDDLKASTSMQEERPAAPFTP